MDRPALNKDSHPCGRVCHSPFGCYKCEDAAIEARPMRHSTYHGKSCPLRASDKVKTLVKWLVDNTSICENAAGTPDLWTFRRYYHNAYQDAGAISWGLDDAEGHGIVGSQMPVAELLKIRSEPARLSEWIVFI